MPQVNDWFVQINGGLSTFSMSLKRNAILAETFANIILLLSKNNLSDLITIQLKKTLESFSDYLECINAIFPYLTDKIQGKEELLKSKTIDGWINLCIGIAEDQLKNDYNVRRQAVRLMAECLMCYPEYIDKTLGKSTQIIDLIKKSTRDHSMILRYKSLEILFKILDNFAKYQNPMAALIY